MSFLKDLDNLLDTKLTKDDDSDNDAKLVDHDDEFRINLDDLSKIKKKNVEIEDEKYAGTEVNFDQIRKKSGLASDDEMEEDDEDSAENSDDESFVDSLVGDVGDMDEEEDGDEDLENRAAGGSESGDDDKNFNDDELPSDEDSGENPDPESGSEDELLPKIELFQSNKSTLHQAQATKLQLQIIENLYSSRIKLQKLSSAITEHSVIDEEEEKVKSYVKKLENKLEEIYEKLESLSSKSNAEMINFTFERTKLLGGFGKLEKNPNQQVNEILEDRERLIKGRADGNPFWGSETGHATLFFGFELELDFFFLGAHSGNVKIHHQKSQNIIHTSLMTQIFIPNSLRKV